jgi:hypothetical protein
MEKIISSRQNAKDGKQEYLIQRERGQTELDRSGSWTYSWRNEDDLEVTEEGGVLITAYADELEVRRAARELEVHRAAGAAVLRPADDTLWQTAPNATEVSEDIEVPAIWIEDTCN